MADIMAVRDNYDVFGLIDQVRRQHDNTKGPFTLALFG